jgi:hypothetical protein
VVKEAESLEANGEHIVPSVLANNLGLRLGFACKSLKEHGYERTEEIDPATHMCIWARIGTESNTDDPAKAEAV